MNDGVTDCICLMYVFSVKCNIDISHLCYDASVRLSVRLSVTEVHWRFIANLGFKFRSRFTVHCREEGALAYLPLDHLGHAAPLWAVDDEP